MPEFIDNLLSKIFDNAFVDKIKDVFAKISRLSIFQRSPSAKFIAIAFCCIILLLAIFSVVSVIVGSDSNKNEEETTVSAHSEVSLDSTFAQEELVTNCLFVLTDNDKQSISNLILIRLNSLEDSMRICFIDPRAKQRVNNIDGSMEKHLQNGGVSELVWAISDKYGISVDRYLQGDENSFVKLLSEFGNIEVNIEEKISYTHNGVSFIIDKGQRVLTPDMMLKYFLYLSDNTETCKDKIVELMLIYSSYIFKGSDEENTEELVEEYLGYFETDISALDYSRYKNALESLSRGDISQKVTIDADPVSFKTESDKEE